MIKLSKINKIYRTATVETQALADLDLEVNKGEFLSIMGPSGCGKSTLLNIMGLLDTPSSGTIEIAGRDTTGMRDKEMARFRNETLGFIFQSFHLIPTLNVLDNVTVPLLYRKGFKGSKNELARKALERVGLSHRMSHFPSQLSGGGHSPSHSRKPADHTCRRTLRQPRLQNERRNYGDTPLAQQRGRPHHRDGDAQRGTGRRNRPHRAFLRRTTRKLKPL